MAGYLYYVLEEDKGLIGDLYVRRRYHTEEREDQLLDWALRTIAGNPLAARIESQLMMLHFSPGRPVPLSDCLSSFERNFMRIDLNGAEFPEGHVRRPMYIENWSDHYHDAAASLIAAAYAGHVDSRINDQYRSTAGARRFLYNIVQYPGCGTFYRPASYAAFEAARGRLCGISLASLVAPDCGHITQICVSPDGARHRHRVRAVAPVAHDAAGDGLPLGQPHGDRGERRRRQPVRARGLPHGAEVLGLRLGRLVVRYTCEQESGRSTRLVMFETVGGSDAEPVQCGALFSCPLLMGF